MPWLSFFLGFVYPGLGCRDNYNLKMLMSADKIIIPRKACSLQPNDGAARQKHPILSVLQENTTIKSVPPPTPTGITAGVSTVRALSHKHPSPTCSNREMSPLSASCGSDSDLAVFCSSSEAVPFLRRACREDWFPPHQKFQGGSSLQQSLWVRLWPHNVNKVVPLPCRVLRQNSAFPLALKKGRSVSPQGSLWLELLISTRPAVIRCYPPQPTVGCTLTFTALHSPAYYPIFCVCLAEMRQCFSPLKPILRIMGSGVLSSR